MILDRYEILLKQERMRTFTHEPKRIKAILLTQLTSVLLNGTANIIGPR